MVNETQKGKTRVVCQEWSQSHKVALTQITRVTVPMIKVLEITLLNAFEGIICPSFSVQLH